MSLHLPQYVPIMSPAFDPLTVGTPFLAYRADDVDYLEDDPSIPTDLSTWTENDATLTDNGDGTYTLEDDNSTTSTHGILESWTGDNLGAIRLTVEVKDVDADRFSMWGANTSAQASFSLVDGEIVYFSGNALDASIVDIGDGWYRCSFDFTTPSSPIVRLRLNTSTYAADGRSVLLRNVSIEYAEEYVTQVNDRTGNGRHATATGLEYPQGTATNSEIGSQPSLDFDGVDDELRWTGTMNKPLRVFVVAVGVSDNDYLSGAANVIDGGAGNTMRIYFPSEKSTSLYGGTGALNITTPNIIANNCWDTYEVVFDDSTQSSIVQGGGSNTGDIGATDPDGITLGKLGDGSSNPTACKVAEVIVYDISGGDLTETELSQIRNYLANRYKRPIPPTSGSLLYHLDGEFIDYPFWFADLTKSELLGTLGGANPPTKSGNSLAFDASNTEALGCQDLQAVDLDEWTLVTRLNPDTTGEMFWGITAGSPQLYLANNDLSYNANNNVSWTGVATDHVLSVVRETDDIAVYIDGVEVARETVAKVALPAQSILAGRAASTYYDGTIRSQSLYNKALNSSAREAVESFHSNLT